MTPGWRESMTLFSDPMMGGLALIILIAILMLFPITQRVLNDFGSQVNDGIEYPVFDPAIFSDLGIDPQSCKKS